MHQASTQLTRPQPMRGSLRDVARPQLLQVPGCFLQTAYVLQAICCLQKERPLTGLASQSDQSPASRAPTLQQHPTQHHTLLNGLKRCSEQCSCACLQPAASRRHRHAMLSCSGDPAIC